MDISDNAATTETPAQRPTLGRGPFYPRKSEFGDYWPRIETILQKVMTSKACTSKEWDDSFFQLEPLEATELIETYASCWQSYNAGVYHIHELCGFLNKMMRRDFAWKLFCQNYEEIAKQLGDNNNHVLAVSRVVWQKYLLLPLREKLYVVIWNEFSNFRNANYTVIPPMSVRHSLESFIDFYEDFFENQFLEDTENYFKNSAVVHDHSQSMYEKMAKSASILDK
ncbi:hypothetical protein M3Y97_00936300 [Aphelenchoides bicaudatus]|nr:hypothetical protein M3Y97_00936300 [Aphelenchoides bicaudatus]